MKRLKEGEKDGGRSELDKRRVSFFIPIYAFIMWLCNT